MKKTLIAIMLAGAVCSAAPHHGGGLRGGHDGSRHGRVVQMAQKDSGASFDALCVAVYEAVKADPNSAVDIFKSVMMQRESWSATETYSVLRSVLLASPALEDGFVANAHAYNNNPGSYVPVHVESMGYQLLATLYTMPQTQPVAGTVAQGVAATTITGEPAGSGITSSGMEVVVPNAPAVTPEQEEQEKEDYPVTPTPPPVSPNN